jgi:hypothetical protein
VIEIIGEVRPLFGSEEVFLRAAVRGNAELW